MERRIINSKLYISFRGDSSLFDDITKKEIEKTFKCLFKETSSKLSDLKSDEITEIIYEIKTPIIKEETLMREFFEKLEVLLESLSDYNPHFTQLKGGYN